MKLIFHVVACFATGIVDTVVVLEEDARAAAALFVLVDLWALRLILPDREDLTFCMHEC